MHWSNPNNIEVLLQEEIQDKKRTARGSFHNVTHRGGGKNGARLKTQVDFLTGKAKREYVKGSVIVTTNFYSELKNCPSFKELKGKEPVQAKNILTEVRKDNTIKSIQTHLKVSGYKLYKFYDEIGVEYVHRGSLAEQREKKETREKKSHHKKEINYLNAPAYVPEEAKESHYKQEESNVSRERFNELVAEAKNKDWENYPFNNTYTEAKEETVPPIIPVIQKTEEVEEWQLKYIKNNCVGAELQKRILDFMTIVCADKNYSVEFILKELPENN